MLFLVEWSVGVKNKKPSDYYNYVKDHVSFWVYAEVFLKIKTFSKCQI